ncbi:MAG TPA: glycosyltransferase family 2 protein [Terracidiphilus sp.]|jgi:teichuronic acid biosynthesis glycosyltransferase TuaG
MPVVTIITPVFNAARWLPEMLASVASQTFTDWEHILVDDGSADDSVGVIESAAARDPRIRLLQMPSNGGPAKARNCAIDASRGRYLAFLDADDLWLPEKLGHSLAFMKRQRCSFVYHAFRYLSADGKIAGALVKGPPRMTLETLHTRRGTGDCMSIVIDREKVAGFHFPKNDVRSHEDWLAWLWLLQQRHAGQLLPEDLGRYRLSTTSRNADKLSAAWEVWHLYRIREGLSWPRAAYWWSLYAWNSLWLHLRSRPRFRTEGSA